MPSALTAHFDQNDLPEGLTASEEHELFANERRRVLVSLLDDRTSTVDLDELAAAVGERASDVDASDGDAQRALAIELHHLHLPLMDDFDVVDYDRSANVVDPS